MARNTRRDWDDDFDSTPSTGTRGARGRSRDDFDRWEEKDNEDYRSEPQAKFNIAQLLVSILLAPIIWPVCMFMYESMEDFPKVLLIGLIFALLGIVVGFVVHLTSKIGRTFKRNLSPARGAIPVVATILLASVLMGVLSMGFQWLYQSRFSKMDEPTSYIFIIDNSGSMIDSDPDQERYESISQILDNMDDDFEFMVYGFGNDTVIIREMAPVSDGTDLNWKQSNDATYMKEALETVIADYENDVWDGGDKAQVVLLTDGDANDCDDIGDLENVLEKYNDYDITISTVGLIRFDRSLLQGIADETGGVFVEIDDASDLFSAMSTAVTNKTNDDLLNTRDRNNLGLLFGALRVLFITILGALLGYIKAIAYGQTRAYKAVIISSTIQSLIAGLIMELGTSLLGFEAYFCWLLMWIAMILMICNKFEKFVEPDKKRRVGADF